MTDMDSILTIVENPTRRRILQAVVREPHYPLQLSKELGISQQAVVKNLELMEREGLLESYRESSNRGPNRILYKPSSEFSITIDMRDSMFEMRMVYSGERAGEAHRTKTHEEERLEEIRAKISSIDRQIAEFDRRRSEMVRERNDLINSFLDCTYLDGLDYEHREILYGMLNRPNWSTEEISKSLGFNEAAVSRMIEDLLECMGRSDTYDERQGD